MKLTNLTRGVDVARIKGSPEGDVSSICYESGRCTTDALFIAIAGLKADGHDYIAAAIKAGARFIVHEKDFEPPAGVTAIQVRDSRRALGILGKNFYGDPSAEVTLIGVVGTNGKTTITYLLESILSAAGYRVGVIGTVNYRFRGKTMPAPNTTPESIEMQRILLEMVDAGVSHVIAEVSSHAIDLHRIDDCSFELGIFTNLSQDHLDYHVTMENYFAAKKRFFTEVLPEGAKGQFPMIINGDDPWGKRILKELAGLSALSYGVEPACDIKAHPYHLSMEGIEATITGGGRSFKISSQLIGKYNLYNILAAVGAAISLEIPKEAIIAGLKELRNVPGRIEKVSSLGEPQVFVDYAHTEDALYRVLQNLAAFKKGRLITVFGCGGDRDRGKRPLMGKAAVRQSDLAIVTSDNPRTEDPMAIIAQIEAGIQEERAEKLSPQNLGLPSAHGYTVIPDRKEAIEAAVSVADADDIVLIAGKGHEDYQIIGTTRFPFDDRLIATQALKKKRPER
ncbi:MAG: UDP-N-acetylmuramoyl-L-alanyl-D-glutamate--2,6-diaminopimelate ligase [Smithellaceae bacterium]|nr:UDP-N-acetylmuramoyl-L-alanyl-D-glutamate--2,6-diaminopimelate ligase [Smithellaceae bacterium]